MGQPVKIVELAERMIRLSGLEPGLDIEIVFSGMLGMTLPAGILLLGA